MTDLQLHGPLLLNGRPVPCPTCGSGGSLDLDRRGPRETWPAWLSCRACGDGGDHPLITNGLVAAALTARAGDAFTAQWRDHVLTGERLPQFTPADLVDALGELRKAGQQSVRKAVRSKKRGARRWWRGRKRAARKATRRAASRATGTVKAATLRTAWDLQTGGAGPQKQPRTRCRTKGCRGGWITITSRLHSASGSAEKMQVPCGVCHRA